MKGLLYLFSFVWLTSNIYSQVNTEKFRIAADSLGFSVRSDIDFTLMKGNADFSFLGTNTRLNYNRGIDYTFLVLNGGFGSNKGAKFFSQALFHLRNVNSISKLISIEEFIQYDNNKQILLKHRALAGVGLRIKLIENDEFVMRIGPSVFFEHETYDLDSLSVHKHKSNLVRMNLYLTSLINLQEDIKFLGITYFQPAASALNDFRILFDGALNIELGKAVDLMVKLQMRFDNLPPDNVKKFDLVSKFGIAINF
jgi:putative salt-induced outer membrane protein YdiY